MSNPHKGRTGLDRILHATGYSWAGLKAAYTGESAFRQETWLVIIGAPIAFWLGKDWVQVALLLGSLLLVLIVELLNSAIEAVVDRVSFEMHHLSKRAKDIASAAVMLALAAAVWQHLR
jgi:diacylglycerol kinase (ATP)